MASRTGLVFRDVGYVDERLLGMRDRPKPKAQAPIPAPPEPAAERPLVRDGSDQGIVDLGTQIRRGTSALSFNRYADYVDRMTGLGPGGRTPPARPMLVRATENGRVVFEQRFDDDDQAQAAHRVFSRSRPTDERGRELQWSVVPADAT